MIQIAVGILIGILSAFSLPTLLVSGLFICIIYIFRRDIATSEEKNFITHSLLLAMGLRIFLSIVMLGFGRSSGIGSDIFGDAMVYEGVAAYIKELISGSQIKTGLWGDNLVTVQWLRRVWQGSEPQLGGIYSVPFISYWYGYLNSFWGLSFLAAKIFNGLLWTVASFWLYLFFKERFTNIETKFGLLILLFFPSYLIFSSSGLKDSLLFFAIIAVIFSCHRLERSNHHFYAGAALIAVPILNKFLSLFGLLKISFLIFSLLIIGIMLIIYIRKYWLFWVLIIPLSGLFLSMRQYIGFFIFLFSIFILASKINFKNIFIKSLPIIIFILVIFGVRYGNNLSSYFQSELKFRISESVLQTVNTAYGLTTFHIYPERFYSNPGLRDTITYFETLIACLNGLRYVFFQPTPWAFNKTPFIMAMWPEAIFMWLFFPFILLGMIVIFKINIRIALPMSLFLFGLTLILALGQGNMGTLVRTRCMITPWYYMIGALGLKAAGSYIFKSRP